MKQQSAISSRLSTTTANASRKAITHVRKFRSLLGILTVLMLTTAAGDSSTARFNNLGHRMICTCGCEQVLLECNHDRFGIGPCETAIRMRGELRAALQKGDNDDMIRHTFAQKYGITVFALRSKKDVTKLASIVGFTVLAAAASIVIVLVYKRQSRPPIVTTPVAELRGIDVEALRRAREETENDDCR